jgi:hypothetical protein
MTGSNPLLPARFASCSGKPASISTNLFPYLPTFSAYQPTYLPTFSVFQPTYLPTFSAHQPTYLPTFSAYQPT